METQEQQDSPPVEQPDQDDQQQDDQEEQPRKDERPSPPQQAHAERVRHNERTGGGEVREGELDEQREEHNRRVAGVSD